MYKSNIIEIFTGFAVLIIAIIIGIFAFNKIPLKNKISSDCYVVKAYFANANGINTESNVKLSGIKIGTVTSLNLQKDYGVTIEMCIQKNISLPIDSSASIVYENLLGKKYIDIIPGSSNDIMSNGSLISRTDSGLDINIILGKLINLILK
ncbi:MCE family protein [Neoehrlichia mikurensis]|uniref:MlaD family protein n=1 Tax=Neoehrlichia mikurensis TaxID=89586 RepID=A0A9Q9F4E0_9RICK|nr:MlaD family protein [Neoehrlichia mikurensis]QXK92220.1 MCE family protein [Neoehrlichia mikurensis]QXK92675.1 MCE family protein [Neoehrlichia mikurensis]QXK93913.1 MCE family protein [Neoehrlichia mikurensis]UTO55086.1 MlaD family protein [Neoehrlichia mikurensis]UTO56005.1 MlaD family protein [Neoehrlichia mikurensis]